MHILYSNTVGGPENGDFIRTGYGKITELSLTLISTIQLLQKNNPSTYADGLTILIRNLSYAFTFPFTFAITSSAIFVGAGE
jgi:hypothetical protein